MSSPALLTRARTGLAVLGAAALLLGGVSVASQAAGEAKPLLTGKANKAKKVTTLTSKKGPALSLRSKKGPALAVNTSDLVPHLNADLVDGKDAATLAPTTTRYLVGARGNLPGQYLFQTPLAAGTYELAMHGAFQEDSGGTGFFGSCVVLDRNVVTAPSNPEFVYLADSVNETSSPTIVHDANTLTFNAPVTLLFGCILSGDATFGHPMTLTVRPVTDIVAGASSPATLGPRGEAVEELLQLVR
jgi:hypothetical protein